MKNMGPLCVHVNSTRSVKTNLDTFHKSRKPLIKDLSFFEFMRSPYGADKIHLKNV